ncbi:hypothetical protein CVT24_011492 [Panaeolus cyanescens]|uniref:cellulose 1,4-beta-cellobiosidase (non-reducing end) n=1 Tax=Panaeolus cyanescens TaxID=181874 RepID=A0A409YGU4_9AGAR|nr:hypothetical protein CVT24_011492 [Panaeolus cyanescens]
MFSKAALLSLVYASIAYGQGVGSYQAETHPSLSWQRCTSGGSCQTVSGSVVLDSNWRWIHINGDYKNCYTGNTWDSSICSSNSQCTSQCVLEGAEYQSTYGITTSGNALTLKFIQPNSSGKNIGSRVYLMADDSKYEMFKLLNQEFTFDVDVSGLPCGLNGALYFSAMDEDGGMGRFSGNKAGAKYGTGYCDSQCPRDIKWINGEANAEGWEPSDNDANAGKGQYGTCCNEMDIWEANSISTAYTPHPCDDVQQTRCSGSACGGFDNRYASSNDANAGKGQYGTCCNEMDIWEANSISTAYTPHPCDDVQQTRCSGSACGGFDNRYASSCDPDGCDFNSYRMGDTSFYGPGKTVDTSSKFTVVTQFLTDDGTSNGNLKEIRRLYVQNGQVIQNSKVNVPGMDAFDSITEEYCSSAKSTFGDQDSFGNHGGLAGIGSSMKNGMVLVLSVWDDHDASMLWLDSTYPTDADPSQPGIARGTCSTDSGKPSDVESSAANAQVSIMFSKAALFALALASFVAGQGVGTYQTETHPRLSWQKCTKSGGCQTQSNGAIVLDSNWRWVHIQGDYKNCYTGNTWDTSICTSNTVCAQKCVLEGADYSGTYGISTSGNALTLKFIQNNSSGKNIGSRVYLMASDTKYEMFKLMNQEFTFDVDVSKLPCGLNGAVYFSSMDEDGGMSRFSGNKAGAKYGTGYCDSQCPRDIKFISGQANSEGWKPASNDANAGTGNYGTCCNEMDIWEANSISTAYTPHPCDGTQSVRCSGSACGGQDNRYGSICDPDGCDFNSYRMGDTSFYGPGKTVNTNSKFTIVTQFISDNGSATGNLKEIRRLYVQNGRVIQNSKVNIPGMSSSLDSITSEFCSSAKTAFGDRDSFGQHGGLTQMGNAIKAGMVLVMSVWDDHTANMLWLDSNYPTDADPSKPGIARGSCPTSSGVPSDVESSAANASVTYSNIKMFSKAALFAIAFASFVAGQGVGTYQAETHPKLPWQKCTKSGGCQTQSNGAIVLDSNWRWVHIQGDYKNCYTGNKWDTSICTSNTVCAQKCVLEGADYSGTYGISTSGNALTLKFIQNNSSGKNIGSRVYLMASDTKYEMFKLMNQEFTFDVDVSKLPCGLNGAVYFSSMDEDGGMSRFSGNKAGAKYGTGYCDSQCPRDIKFISGQANSEGWVPASNDANAGTGNYGTCCNEMDIWEANSISTAYTPHPCDGTQSVRCSGSACGGQDNRYGSICDPDGCDFNSYRMGDTSFYGPGKTVNTNSKFTVVTQFISDNGSSTGNLKEIRRLYVQNGKVIQNSKVNVPGMSSSLDSITSGYCSSAKTAFGDRDSFGQHGGLTQMGNAIKAGMVLVLSVWDDHTANMLWLDSNYPTDADPSKPGIARGSCPTSSGVPSDIESSAANASVTYSNIKVGDIGSTYSA